MSTSRMQMLAGPGAADAYAGAAGALVTGASTPVTSSTSALSGQRTILLRELGDRMGDGAGVRAGARGVRERHDQRGVSCDRVLPDSRGQAERGLRSGYDHGVGGSELSGDERRAGVAGIGGGERRPGPVADVAVRYGLGSSGGAGGEVARNGRPGPDRGEFGAVVRHRDGTQAGRARSARVTGVRCA